MLLLLVGCVERRLTIESDPPGAEAVVDFQPVGKTPVTVPFTFYGQRRIELRMDGYDTLRKDLNILPPWYQWFPIEWVSEFMVPRTIWDRHIVKLELAKAAYDEAALMKRAEEAKKWEWKK